MILIYLYKKSNLRIKYWYPRSPYSTSFKILTSLLINICSLIYAWLPMIKANYTIKKYWLTVYCVSIDAAESWTRVNCEWQIHTISIEISEKDQLPAVWLVCSNQWLPWQHNFMEFNCHGWYERYDWGTFLDRMIYHHICSYLEILFPIFLK